MLTAKSGHIILGKFYPHKTGASIWIDWYHIYLILHGSDFGNVYNLQYVYNW